MRTSRRASVAAGVLAATLFAGCATSIEACDPNTVDNVVMSAQCKSHFEARIARLEEQIAKIEQAQRDEEQALLAAKKAAGELNDKIKAEKSALASLDKEIARARLGLSGLKKQSAEAKRVETALRAQVASAEQALAVAKANAGPTAADFARVDASIKSKQSAIKAMTSLYETIE